MKQVEGGVWVSVGVCRCLWVQRTKQTLTYIHRNNMIQQFIYSWLCVCVCLQLRVHIVTYCAITLLYDATVTHRVHSSGRFFKK
jgi:hypothetical protein